MSKSEAAQREQNGVQIIYYDTFGVVKNQVINNITDLDKAVEFAKKNGYIPKEAKIITVEPVFRIRYRVSVGEEGVMRYKDGENNKFRGFASKYFRGK